uniref:Putative atp-dependent protease pil n=1 Tax=Culex tarsalis TaxID=7177 RepID=A0A1Q3G4B2_CULTA
MCFRRFYTNLACWHREPDDEIVELMNRRRASVQNHDVAVAIAGPSAERPTARFKLTYNIQLPSEHSYLGKLERVGGLELLDPGSVHTIPISGHHSIVYPGETIPLILTNSLLNVDGRTESNRIGLVFWEHPHRKKIYGVICQVCEKDDRESVIVLKTKAQQRFELVPAADGALTKSVQREGRAHYYAQIKILPEVLLPDPLTALCAANMTKANRLQAAQSTVWPKFVYDQYGSDEVLLKVRRFLEFLQIEAAPTASGDDPVALSFWLARNIPLSEADRKEVFFTSSVLARMLLVNNILDFTCGFCCKKCDRRIANYVDMFAMSQQGIAGSYCNPSGFVHETLTVNRTIAKSTRTTTKASTDFSWFPGYAWQIAVCNGCNGHVGWKFAATRRGYKPRKFYGLCGKSVRVASERKVDD